MAPATPAAGAGRPLGELLLVAVLAGALTAGLAAAGLAPPWAVLVGTAGGLGTAATPALPRGLSMLAGGVAGWAAAGLLGDGGAELGLVTGLAVGGLVLAAGAVAHLSRHRIAAWPVVLGAAAVVVGVGPAGPAAAGEVVAVLAGLASGVVAVVVAEAATAWRLRASRAGGRAGAEPGPDVGPVDREELR